MVESVAALMLRSAAINVAACKALDRRDLAALIQTLRPALEHPSPCTP